MRGDIPPGSPVLFRDAAGTLVVGFSALPEEFWEAFCGRFQKVAELTEKY